MIQKNSPIRVSVSFDELEHLTLCPDFCIAAIKLRPNALPLEQGFCGEGGSGEVKAGCLLQQSLHGSRCFHYILSPCGQLVLISVLASPPYSLTWKTGLLRAQSF